MSFIMLASLVFSWPALMQVGSIGVESGGGGEGGQTQAKNLDKPLFMYIVGEVNTYITLVVKFHFFVYRCNTDLKLTVIVH